MYKSKLIDLIRCFDEEELDQLDRYIRAPFFFKEPLPKEILTFWDLIKSAYPHFSEAHLSKEKVYAIVFPLEEWDATKLPPLMVRMMRIIRAFVSQTYRDEAFGPTSEALNMATFYRIKNRKKRFEKECIRALNEQANNSVKDTRYLWSHFLLARETTEYLSLYNTRKSDLNLPHTLSRLDYFYLALRLEYACVLQNQKKHVTPLDIQNSMALFKGIEPLLEQGAYRDEPLIDLLYRTYLLLQAESTNDTFEELKQYLSQYAYCISDYHQHFIHSALRNFCLRMINKGNDQYSQTLFDLYQEGLESELLLYNKKILPSTMQSMVSLGLKLQQFCWVENFLEAYRYRIKDAEIQEEVYSLNRANLLFAQGDFEKALSYLVYNFADIYLRLAARRMEVQIYYEQQSDLLDSKIKAFKIFVYRISQSSLTKIQREGYNNFIDLLKQIIHPSTRFNQKRITSLMAKVKAKKIVAEKQWLLSKLAEID